MIHFLYNWQTLIGSIIGAAAPFSLWFLSQWYQSYLLRKERLCILIKAIGLNLISVLGAYKTVEKFLDEKVNLIINEIKSNSKENEYFLGTAFFPLFSVEPIGVEILEINTSSGYVDNLVLSVIKISRDFASIVDDARKQFARTIDGHRELCLLKKNTPTSMNLAFISNLNQFSSVTKQQMLENNIRIYVELIASTQTAITYLKEIGKIRWQYKFGPSFKYFRNRDELIAYNLSAHNRISSFLKSRTDARVRLIEAEYKSSNPIQTT